MKAARRVLVLAEDGDERNAILDLIELHAPGLEAVKTDDPAEAARLAGTSGPFESVLVSDRFAREPGIDAVAGLWEAGAGAPILIIAPQSPASLPNPRDPTDTRVDMTEIEWFSGLAWENPDPVLRISPNGVVLYTNPPGEVLVDQVEGRAGAPPTAPWRAAIATALHTGVTQEIVASAAERVFCCALVPSGGHVNIYARDITRHTRAEQALRRQKDLINNVIDHIPHFVFWKDRDLRYLGCNRRFATAAGIGSPEEIVGLSDYNLAWTREQAELYRRDDRKVLETGEAMLHIQETIRMADGTDGIIHTSKVPLRDEQGRVVGVIGIFTDISEQVRSSETLRLLSAAVASAANGIVVTDRRGNIVWANPAFSALTGYTLDDVKGDNPRILSSGRHSPMFYAELWRTILSGHVWRDNIVNRRKDGTLYTEEMTVTPVRDDEGEITHFVAIKQDVTGRMQVQDQLRRAHDETELLLSSIPSILIWIDEEGLVRMWNSFAEKTFGVVAGDVRGNRFEDCPIGRDWGPVREAVAKCLARSTPVRLEELRATRADGGPCFLSVTVSPLEGRTQGAAGCLLVATDVTERRILMHQLMQAQKLESIGQLAAGIAHEINTPTQFVGDNTHFLQEAFQSLDALLTKYEELARVCHQAPPGASLLAEVDEAVRRADLDYLRAEVSQAISQSLDGVARVTRIVSAMKDFSHPTAEEMLPVDLNKAIETTTTVARNEWKYVAQLELDLDPGLPPVTCRIGDINQVMLNLIINAAHAIADVVRDSGEMGKIRVSTRQDGDWAEIRVSDSGTGIPEGIRPRVFDHFFTTKEVGKGTGQGLSIAHTVVVQKHGGLITFETEVGVGTTFIVRLPLSGVLANPHETAPGSVMAM